LVTSKSYVPDQGDLVWLDFDPQAGHEQAGRRPALVLSPKSYNQATKLMLCCPVTSRVKGYPFEVLIFGSPKISGVALSDQIRSLDWIARDAQFIDRVPSSVLSEVSVKQKLLLPK
jgi:mRNA interferase MazF